MGNHPISKMNKHIRSLLEEAVKVVDSIDLDDPDIDEAAKMYIPDCFATKFTELLLNDFCAVLEEQIRLDEVLKKKAGIDMQLDFVKELKRVYGIEHE